MPPVRSMLGRRENIPQPSPVISQGSTIKHRLGSGSVKPKCPERLNLLGRRCEVWSPSGELLTRNEKNKNQIIRPRGRSMLGRRENIPQPTPIKPPGSTIIRRLGGGSVKPKFPERLNLQGRRCEVWSPSGELLTQNEKNKKQHFGAQKERTGPSEYAYSMFTSMEDGENISSRPEFNCVTNYTGGNTADKCLQHTTLRAPVSSDSVRLSCFANRPPIPDAPLLLRSNRSKRVADFNSHFSAKSSKLGKTLPVIYPAVVGTSEMPMLLESNRSHRLIGFVSHLSTESSELKTFPATNYKGREKSRACKGLRYDTLQSSAVSRGQCDRELNECSKESASELAVAGTTFDASKCLESETQGSCVSQNKSGKSAKVTSKCAGTRSLNAPFLFKSSNSQGIRGVTSQDEMEYNVSGKAMLHNYGEVKTEDALILTHNQLQSHESYAQAHGTDRIHHVAPETSGTKTSKLIKSKIPHRVTIFSNQGMKSFEEVGNTPSVSQPTTNKPCNGLSFQECASPTQTCTDVVHVVKLPYTSELKVPLSRKKPSISANEKNNMQNISTENLATQNSSVFVIQGNELHESSNTVPYSTFISQNRGAFSVSIATQTDLIVKQNTTVQTDSSASVTSAIEKLEALSKKVAALSKEHEEVIQILRKQENVTCNETVNTKTMIGSEQEAELNNDSDDISEDCVYKDSDMSSRHFISTPLRRSARIAARLSGTVTAESKLAPATPSQLESGEGAKSHSRRSTLKLDKSVTVYKELRSNFCFLKTPQSTRRPRLRTPKNTPNRMLSQRLRDQILSLYD